jgi:hypothetical protein
VGAALALAMQRWVYPAIRRELERRYGVRFTPAVQAEKPAFAGSS